MRKILLATIIFLIIVTSLVKNSTKEIEDQTFSLKENMRTLKSELGDLMLEYNYLSSPNKLIEYQSQYFENDLKNLSRNTFILAKQKKNCYFIFSFNNY